MKSQSTIMILPDIRSAYNVGSIFRTADAAGVDAIYLAGHSPSPIDRFGRPRADIAKVALGAEQTVHWEYFENVNDAIEAARDQDCKIIGVEQAENSISLHDFTSPERVAYIFGNEVEGLMDSTLQQCDTVIEIPMYGQKESLNVAVTVGIVLFK